MSSQIEPSKANPSPPVDRRKRQRRKNVASLVPFLIIIPVVAFVGAVIAYIVKNSKAFAKQPVVDKDKLLVVDIPTPAKEEKYVRKVVDSVDSNFKSDLPVTQACYNDANITSIVKNGTCYIERSKDNPSVNGQYNGKSVEKLRAICQKSRGEIVKIAQPSNYNKPDTELQIVDTCMEPCDEGYVRDPDNAQKCVKYETCPEGMVIKAGNVRVCVGIDSVLKHKRKVDEYEDESACKDLDDDDTDHTVYNGKCFTLLPCPDGWRTSLSNNALCEPDPNSYDQNTVWRDR